MRVLVSGSTGLVGEALLQHLASRGDEATRLVRSSGDGVRWDPAKGVLGDVSGFDAVVHLAGENVAGGRWNAARKQRIRDSRVDGTTLLARGLAEAESKPKVLVCASATGFYGDRGDELLTEASTPGEGFLADVCQEWEAAADAARDAGIRVVHVRIGLVLAEQGGALAKMLTPFKLGVGGIIGNGKQYWSWIALADLVRILTFAIETETLEGPINAVAPTPPTNREFTKTLGRVLGRPTIFPLPAFAARIALGEMADAAILASARAVPERLTEAGFAFEHPELEAALRVILGR